jgi:hypothetical protein
VASGPPIDRRIAVVRSRLAVDLAELRRRVGRVRELLSPATHLRNPWIQLGLGLAAGYAVGRSRRRLAGTAPAPRRARESLLYVAARAAVTGLVSALVKRAAESAIRPRDS